MLIIIMYALNIFHMQLIELQPNDSLTMYYYGEVLGRQRKMEEAKEMFKLAARN